MWHGERNKSETEITRCTVV